MYEFGLRNKDTGEEVIIFGYSLPDAIERAGMTEKWETENWDIEHQDYID